MRMRNWLPALILGLGLLATAAVDYVRAEGPTAADIAKLVEQLGADSFADRQKANATLDKLGEAALEALKKASTHEDTEVRKRAADLVRKIEVRAASAKILAPKMVELSYKDTPVAEAVADFAKKSGYAIKFHDPENKLKDKKVTLETGKVTFWQAYDKFCAAAGVADGDPNQIGAGAGGLPPVGGIGFGGGGIGIAVPMPAPAPAPLPPIKIEVRPKPGVKPAPAPKPATDGDTAVDDAPAKPAKPAPKPAEDKPATGKPVGPKPAKAGDDAAVADEDTPPAPKPPVAVKPAVRVGGVIRIGKAPAAGGAVPAGAPAIAPAPPVAPLPAIAPAVPPFPGGGPGMPGVPVGPNGRPWVQIKQGEINLVPAPADKAPADASSSVRVGVADRKKMPVSVAPTETGLVLSVTPEPRLRLQSITSVDIKTAVDDKGTKVAQADEAANPMEGGGVIIRGGAAGVVVIGGGVVMPGFPGGGMGYFGTSANGLTHYAPVKLKKGDKGATSLKELTGVVNARFLTDAEKLVTVEKILDAKGKKAKGTSAGEIVVTDVVKQADGTYRIDFDLTTDEGWMPETTVPDSELSPVVPAFPGGGPGAVPGFNPGRIRGGVRIGGAAAGGGVAVAVPAIAIAPMMDPAGTYYNGYGVTLRDAKGKVLRAQIQPDFTKFARGLGGRGGFVQPGTAGTMSYTALYKPAKDEDKPASLTYVARKSVAASVPFKLENVDIK